MDLPLPYFLNSRPKNKVLYKFRCTRGRLFPHHSLGNTRIVDDLDADDPFLTALFLGLSQGPLVAAFGTAPFSRKRALPLLWGAETFPGDRRRDLIGSNQGRQLTRVLSFFVNTDLEPFRGRCGTVSAPKTGNLTHAVCRPWSNKRRCPPRENAKIIPAIIPFFVLRSYRYSPDQNALNNLEATILT